MTPTVLIVDDSKLARIVVKRAISQLHPGWFVVEAANGDEALATIEERQIDLAILDYNMPGRNGIELARELRARFPTMPIAVVTANIQDEVIEAAYAADAVFIAKPISADGVRSFLSGAALRLGALD